jgi:hypothetical protein
MFSLFPADDRKKGAKKKRMKSAVHADHLFMRL